MQLPEQHIAERYQSGSRYESNAFCICNQAHALGQRCDLMNDPEPEAARFTIRQKAVVESRIEMTREPDNVSRSGPIPAHETAISRSVELCWRHCASTGKSPGLSSSSSPHCAGGPMPATLSIGDTLGSSGVLIIKGFQRFCHVRYFSRMPFTELKCVRC